VAKVIKQWFLLVFAVRIYCSASYNDESVANTKALICGSGTGEVWVRFHSEVLMI
jgi:hypothetical protein